MKRGKFREDQGRGEGGREGERKKGERGGYEDR